MVMMQQIHHWLDQINRQRKNDCRVFLNSDFRRRLQVAELESSGLGTNDCCCLRQLAGGL